MTNPFMRYSAEQYLIITLVILAVLAITQLSEIVHVAATVAAAIVIDVILTKLRTKRFELPVLALISGLIIALVLKPDPVLGVAAATIAMAGKHAIRWRGRNVFNPAAFGMLVAMLAFATVTTWWATVHWVVVPLGLLVAWRIKRLAAGLSFLIMYGAVYLARTTMAGVPSLPFFDVTIWFFALVMVVEPITSPAPRFTQILFGAGIALLSAALLTIPRIDVLLLALLVMNVAAYRLSSVRSFKSAPAKVSA